MASIEASWGTKKTQEVSKKVVRSTTLPSNRKPRVEGQRVADAYSPHDREDRGQVNPHAVDRVDGLNHFEELRHFLALTCLWSKLTITYTSYTVSRQVPMVSERIKTRARSSLVTAVEVGALEGMLAINLIACQLLSDCHDKRLTLNWFTQRVEVNDTLRLDEGEPLVELLRCLGFTMRKSGKVLGGREGLHKTEERHNARGQEAPKEG